VVKQTLQRRRGTVERHSEFLPHHGQGEIDVLDAAQHVGDEVAVFETRRIPTVGHLVVRRAIDVAPTRLIA
jgi:hypothetical protein